MEISRWCQPPDRREMVVRPGRGAGNLLPASRQRRIPPATSHSMSPLHIKRDAAKGKVFSHIRNDWLVETPEELVRQEFVCHLVNDYGYALDQMGEEIPLPWGRGSVRADIIVWKSAQEKRDLKPPRIVIECKSNNIVINPRDYEQGESYARNSDAPFFVTHNQRETKVWRVSKDRMSGQPELITDIPRADASQKEIEELIKKLKVFKEDEFADLLHKCHNEIRNREHLDPAAAFDEIAKVLFMKVCFERLLRRGRDRRNLFTADFLDEQGRLHKDPVQVLFDATTDEYAADYLFALDEKIALKFATVREIVRLLEKYNLSDTSEDVKGIAFEKFLGRTFRGEIGQFFTPREVVRFMVEMADPKFGDIICDPASGSGGFLIRFFAKVREQLTAEADAEYESTRAAVEKKKLPAAKKAALLREADDHRRRLLDVKNEKADLWRLSNRCIYGTDANDRMARTSKMNMIMHGDGHGGVHQWNGFLNVNGIFEGRFDILLTNPPFGSQVESSAVVEIPDGKEWDESKRRYSREYGQLYKDAVARVEAAQGEPIASLFDLPKRGGDGKGKLGKIKTELLFLERCLDLLTDGEGKRPAGRLGIVLPEGVFNNPSLQWVRDFVEDRAWLRAVISLPQDTFMSSGASVKCSILFLQKFTAKEKANYDRTSAKARAETGAKYAPEMEKERARIAGEIAILGSARAPRAVSGAPAGNVETAGGAAAISEGGAPRVGDESSAGARKTAREGAGATQDARKVLLKELADYERAMEEKIAAESRALLKQRCDYPIFLYEVEHVGITATGERTTNELYPNDRQPPGDAKTCLELFREFERDPQAFFVAGPVA